MFDLLIAPFTEFEFMQRALWTSLLIAAAGAPVGVFMGLRRLSLLGDALGHAILPGVALAYLFAGFSAWALFVGGVTAGLVVAGLSILVSELSSQREDNALAVFYLLSLSLGVVLVSTGQTGNSSVDLMHILFGSVLSLTAESFKAVLFTSLFVLLCFGVFGRLLLFEAVDASFGKQHAFPVRRVHFLFLFLVVVTLVAAFQALGTLMSLGLMLIPAAAARFFVRRLVPHIFLSFVLAAIASVSGLLLSFHISWPSGPAIVLSAGALYLFAFLFGREEGLLIRKFFPRTHKQHKKIVSAAVVVLAFVSIFSQSSFAAPIRVVASFSIPAEMVKSLGAEDVQVTSLVLPGQEVHDYQPRPKDLVQLQKADLFVYNGLGLESWAPALVSNANFKGKVLKLSDALPKNQLIAGQSHDHGGHHHHHDHDDGAEDYDPHCWQDPRLGVIYLDSIRLALISLRPEIKDSVDAKFAALKAELLATDLKLRDSFTGKAAASRKALSPHQSFAYLQKAYGLDFVSPKGNNPGLEASAKRLSQIETELKSGQIKVAIVETDAAAQSISDQIQKYGLRKVRLHSDSLTHSEDEAPTYLRLIQINAERLLEAFPKESGK